jgi:hypothetical protein
MLYYFFVSNPICLSSHQIYYPDRYLPLLLFTFIIEISSASITFSILVQHIKHFSFLSTMEMNRIFPCHLLAPVWQIETPFLAPLADYYYIIIIQYYTPYASSSPGFNSCISLKTLV